MAKTRAQVTRAIRQESLRELLSKQKHIEQVVKNIKKIEELAIEDLTVEDGKLVGLAEVEKKKFELNKLKIANEQRMRLINKYLPDLKSTEHTGEGGNPLTVLIGEISGNTLEPDSD